MCTNANAHVFAASRVPGAVRDLIESLAAQGIAYVPYFPL
jgi:hypothetical protein